MVLDLYPSSVHEGDLTPDAFGSEIDDICNEIHAACKGWGTNEQRLLRAMGGMTPEQRCQVPIRYKQLHGKVLVDVVKSECGNKDFGTALQLLAVDPVSAECAVIDKACKGAGTDELLVFTVICGRSNKEIDILKKKYFDLNTKDLGKKLDSELGGSLESLILNCLQGSEEAFDPGFHTEDKAKEDAEALYKMGQGKLGTNEAGIFKILCARPPEHLKKVNLIYADKYGFTLTKMLEKELSGKSEKAATFLIGMKLKPYEEVANLIKAACAGFGTNELLLTSTLIRYQKILREVSKVHQELFGKSVRDRVKSETRGDYERVLMEILETADI